MVGYFRFHYFYDMSGTMLGKEHAPHHKQELSTSAALIDAFDSSGSPAILCGTNKELNWTNLSTPIKLNGIVLTREFASILTIHLSKLMNED